MPAVNCNCEICEKNRRGFGVELLLLVIVFAIISVWIENQ